MVISNLVSDVERFTFCSFQHCICLSKGSAVGA